MDSDREQASLFKDVNKKRVQDSFFKTNHYAIINGFSPVPSPLATME